MLSLGHNAICVMTPRLRVGLTTDLAQKCASSCKLIRHF
nr:MAG TPA: hypothetical protein [Caudoviricetes sp.]